MTGRVRVGERVGIDGGEGGGEEVGCNVGREIPLFPRLDPSFIYLFVLMLIWLSNMKELSCLFKFLYK